MLVALALVSACQSGGGAAGGQEQPSVLHGGRQNSPSVQASAARPRPGAEPDENPLEGHRLGLDEAMARARRAHGEEHSQASLALEDFSHPACSALPREARRTCPLSSVRWSGLRTVTGGVEFDTSDPRVDPTRLRWQFLCHIAFERSHGGKGCPLGTPGLDLSVIKIGSKTTVRLAVHDRTEAERLHQRLRPLIASH
jgi:hypothetical protein